MYVRRYNTYIWLCSHTRGMFTAVFVVIWFGLTAGGYGQVALSGADVTDLLTALAATLCPGVLPCGANSQILFATCSCVCVAGFETASGGGIPCMQRVCANQGSWSNTLGSCECQEPFTSASGCTVATCAWTATFDPTEGVCVSDIRPTPAIDVNSVWAFGEVPWRRNWGVAQCADDGSNICVCPPLYFASGYARRTFLVPTGVTWGQFYEVQNWFLRVAPLCCTGVIACETQVAAEYQCMTQACCNQLSGSQCFQMGCSFENGICILNSSSLLPVGTFDWVLDFVNCSLSDDPLCDPLTSAEQTHLLSTVDPSSAFAELQGRPWPGISAYPNWDDLSAHTLVMWSASQACSALVGIDTRSGAQAVPLVWACGAHTSESFVWYLEQLDAARVRPEIVVPAGQWGSVYRLWDATRQYCVVGRPLYADETLLLGYTGGSSAVAISIALVGDTVINPDYCGAWRLTNGTLKSLEPGSTMSLMLGPSGAVNIAANATGNGVAIGTAESAQVFSAASCDSVLCGLDAFMGASEVHTWDLTMRASATCSGCILPHIVLDS